MPPPARLASGELLIEYIKAVYEGGAREVLLQAYALRQLVVILDGADEATSLRGLIEQLVLGALAPLRVVLSSRPQNYNGVDAARFCHFVIINLKPLTPEQQRAAIMYQLEHSPQEVRNKFDHLDAFRTIRFEHDRIYETKAFADAKERRTIEEFEQPNCFFRDGARDPQMRQWRRDGQRFVGVSTAAAPASAYLQWLSNFFTAVVLEEMEALLAPLDLGASEEAVQAAVERMQGSDAVRRLRGSYGERLFALEAGKGPQREALKEERAFKELKLAAKLGQLLLKRRRKHTTETATELWCAPMPFPCWLRRLRLPAHVTLRASARQVACLAAQRRDLPGAAGPQEQL